jgi:hypothetical protein
MVDDQLHFMQAFEIGHLWRVTRFHQGFVTRLDQFDEAAAKHDLLAEQVRLTFLLEGGLDDAGATAAVGRGIGEREIMGVAG